LGKNMGFITYSFDINNLPETLNKLTVKTRISSHSKKPEQKQENASDITLTINGVDLGTKQIFFYWPNCPITEWAMDNKKLKKLGLKNKRNELRFEIKKTAKHKNGMSIYYKGLNEEFTKLEMPIVVEWND